MKTATMNRTMRIVSLFTFVFLALLSGVDETKADRPNIIIIYADEQDEGTKPSLEIVAELALNQ